MIDIPPSSTPPPPRPTPLPSNQINTGVLKRGLESLIKDDSPHHFKSTQVFLKRSLVSIIKDASPHPHPFKSNQHRSLLNKRPGIPNVTSCTPPPPPPPAPSYQINTGVLKRGLESIMKEEAPPSPSLQINSLNKGSKIHNRRSPPPPPHSCPFSNQHKVVFKEGPPSGKGSLMGNRGVGFSKKFNTTCSPANKMGWTSPLCKGE